MKTITFSAIKGGVGKTSISVLTANCLARAGNKILLIDMDIQNSLSFYYLPEDEGQKNIAKALYDNDLKANVIKYSDSIDIIPSSFNLLKLRSIDIKTLSRLIAQVEKYYDYLIIDTSPTYDNIVLNAVLSSDLIISPVNLSSFDWKSALFYRDQIEIETDKINNWKLLINRFDAPRTDNIDAEINQYLDLFQSDFPGQILNTKIPSTTMIRKAIDTQTIISKAKSKIKLFDAVVRLCSEITNKKIIVEDF